MARKKIEKGSKEALRKQEFGERVFQIREILFAGNNRKFAEQIGESEQNLSQICSGDRNGGWAIVQKILDNIPEINANWLLRGEEEMTRNVQQRVGDITGSTVSGVNVNGNDIQINPDAYNTLLAIVETHQREVLTYQEQIDRLIKIIEHKL